MSSSNTQPFVSIIIPVYNGELMVEKNIHALLDQDYPKDRYEIIYVDNSSQDNTREIITKYPVILFEEKKQNSYAARNLGIRHAKGEVLVFTDIDCISKTNWVSEGVMCLKNNSADIVAGNIQFTFSVHPTASELTDSVINLDNKSGAEKGLGKTANLFIKKSVFNEIGLFSEKGKSGGDGEWTTRARRANKRIVFSEQATVLHEARNFSELVHKHIRVGKGSINVWKSQGRSLLWIWLRFFSLFLPILSLQIPFLIKQRALKSVRYPILRMMVIAYVCKVATAWGILSSLFFKYNHKHTEVTGTQPLVSVIIPVHNRPVIVLDAIKSVQDQTWDNWELIIVDDASSDNTWEVIQNIVAQDDRIRVFKHEKNKDCGAARNTGISHTKGAYIAFLDSDDVWLPEKLEKQMQVFGSDNNDLGLVYTGVIIINSHNERRDKRARQGGRLYNALCEINIIGSPSRVMVTREALNSCGGFDETLISLEDWDLWLRISRKYQIGLVPEPLVVYKESADSISGRSDKKVRSYEAFWKKHGQNKQPGRLGHRLCYHGSMQEGRRYLFEALRLQPWNFKYLFLWTLSFFGSRAYYWVVFNLMRYGI